MSNVSEMCLIDFVGLNYPFNSDIYDSIQFLGTQGKGKILVQVPSADIVALVKQFHKNVTHFDLPSVSIRSTDKDSVVKDIIVWLK